MNLGFWDWKLISNREAFCNNFTQKQKVPHKKALSVSFLYFYHMPVAENITKPKILNSCYFSKSRSGEQFVPDHIFSYQVAGSMIAYDGKNTYRAEPGDLRLSKRNHLAKFEKFPSEGGEYQSVSLFLTQDILKEISLEYPYKIEKNPYSEPIVALPKHPAYLSFMESLVAYFAMNQHDDEKLFRIKIKEAIHLILKINPELRHTLFDFNEPGKIDLEAFMNRNFHFNVQLKRFAYLTGRSLATFKRDFQKAFSDSPSRWLQQRRLQEAYYLIKKKSKTPSEVYLEVGFEDLSHFSFAFKKQYGSAPSKI